MEMVEKKILKEKQEMARKGERYLTEKEALAKYRRLFLGLTTWKLTFKDGRDKRFKKFDSKKQRRILKKLEQIEKPRQDKQGIPHSIPEDTENHGFY